jgi:hypothetical protein
MCVWHTRTAGRAIEDQLAKVAHKWVVNCGKDTLMLRAALGRLTGTYHQLIPAQAGADIQRKGAFLGLLVFMKKLPVCMCMCVCVCVCVCVR